MARIEMDSVVTTEGLTQLHDVFTPKEFKDFCLSRGWKLSLGEESGHAFFDTKRVAAHWITSKTTYFFHKRKQK